MKSISKYICFTALMIVTCCTSGGGGGSSLLPPAGYTTSQLIFEDTFTGHSLDSTKWTPAIADQNGIWQQSVPSPYSAVNAGGFNAEYFDPAQISTGPSGLKIVATRSNRFAGYTWKSGAICTHGKFTFAGGYAQIRMKQPDVSTGGWPGFWHLEGGAEIDTQEGGFLNGSVSSNGVLANALLAATNEQRFFDAGVDLSADYHVWGMEYIPGVSIKFYFDGVLKRTVTTNVPTDAMTLLINLSIANSSASGWHTAYDSSTPATLELEVTDVQVYHLSMTDSIEG
ncbi:glycoside hydrolase family 16 protein [Mesorhizobium sp. M0203]|uniref:glycoside hydrolase family 16 protein n=1 Tax=unclassified Mesorhizobium TaxID=325217 RepID=UPI00333C21FD